MEVAIIVAVAAVAIGVVVFPLVTRGTEDIVPLSEEALNEQVARYRDAIRRSTLCDHCLTANTVDSKFCAECGRAL